MRVRPKIIMVEAQGKNHKPPSYYQEILVKLRSAAGKKNLFPHLKELTDALNSGYVTYNDLGTSKEEIKGFVKKQAEFDVRHIANLKRSAGPSDSDHIRSILWQRFLARESWVEEDQKVSSDLIFDREVEKFQKMWKWHLVVEEYRDELEVTLATGSGSGSLVGFSRAKGLLPVREMLGREDVVPFCGELSEGISYYGVNHRAISFAYAIERALYYAKASFNLTGWHPDLEFRDLGYDTVVRETRKTIQAKRLALWPNLTRFEQSLVANPYPIVYGIVGLNLEKTTLAGFRHMPRGYDSEFYFRGFLPIERSGGEEYGKISIFCPLNKLRQTSTYLHQQGVFVRVLPFQALEFSALQKETFFELTQQVYKLR